MIKIYLQNPEKTQVVVFDNENQIGAGFFNWIKLNQEEIDAYLLQQAKDNKIKELETAYTSKKTWLYTLYSKNTNPAVLKGVNATLTRDSDFFLLNFPSCFADDYLTNPEAGVDILFYDDKNQVVKFFLTTKKNISTSRKIRSDRVKIKEKMELLLSRVNNSTTQAEINAIKIEEELQNAVDRQINMDN